MGIYTVHLPPGSNSIEAVARARLVKRGVAWWGLIAPPLFLIWHRLWFALAVYVLLAAVLALLPQAQLGILALMLSALPGIFLFLEGHELVRERLGRLGWGEAAVVEAANVAEAELRFFHEAGPAEVANVRALFGPQAGEARIAAAQPAGIGLFDP